MQPWRHRWFVALACAGALSTSRAWSDDHAPVVPNTPAAGIFSTRVADSNSLGITLTNYGFFGNNFISRAPSLEYPLGTGYEHLPVGGLWVGAHATDAGGAFTGVTTAWNDASIGIPAQSRTEFTPVTDLIVRRSNLPSSSFFDPLAVSNMD